MRFYSTNHKSPLLSLKEVLLKGQAPDRGLYMPETIPTIPMDVINSFPGLAYSDIAYSVTNFFLEKSLPSEEIKKITQDAYNFDVPLVSMGNNCYILRLDQGPTSSFKDFAARMMARLMQYFLKKDGRDLLILTATSGDTGGAVADAFFGMDNIKVVILYPKDEISARQRKQMTTLGNNITALGLDAKFDDCQALVKEAFADSELSALPLSSANSINFGRILPQIVYYFYAHSRIPRNINAEMPEVIFSVPSGNFGDLMGGVIAKKMGLPVKRFVVAVNENNEFPLFLDSDMYNQIVPSRNCLSNAMNVGHPSNLARLIDLYGGHLDEKGHLSGTPDMDALRRDFFSISISDEKTRETISKVHKSFQYVLEPHGAVAWAGLETFLAANSTDAACIAFETADPAKFPETITELLGIDPPITERMHIQATLTEKLVSLKNNYGAFKKFLSEHFA